MRNTIQQIFVNHYSAYTATHSLPLKHLKAADAIMHCRTASLGGQIQYCPEGHESKIQYHSCRHRSCPKCSAFPKIQWAHKQQTRLLKCDHFHVVFTIPHELLTLWRYNTAWFTHLIFQCARDTLMELLEDKKYLNATPGIVMALHTWGRNLSLHPHVHCLVSGGGLSKAQQWKAVENQFLLPIKVVKSVYRGKMLAHIINALRSGELVLPANMKQLPTIGDIKQLYKKEWSVRIQERYSHGAGVMKYLAKYVKGGPLNERRIIQANKETVKFEYRDHRTKSNKVLPLSTDEFISRILCHVPEPGIHTIRHYGLYSHQSYRKRAKCRVELGQSPETSDSKINWLNWLKEMKHCTLTCKVCHTPLVRGRNLTRELATNSYIRQFRERHVQQGVQADALDRGGREIGAG